MSVYLMPVFTKRFPISRNPYCPVSGHVSQMKDYFFVQETVNVKVPFGPFIPNRCYGIAGNSGYLCNNAGA